MKVRGKPLLNSSASSVSSDSAASWVIVSRQTGKPVFETFERSTADRVNRDKYEVLAVHDWLIRYNAEVSR